MSDEGWVRLADIEPGGLYETADGRHWRKPGVGSPTGSDYALAVPFKAGVNQEFDDDTLVRPLTAMPLHPSLRVSDLPGLCAAVLGDPNEGTYGRLLDWLAEATGRDPDVAAATRERCLREAEQEAALRRGERDQAITHPAEWHRCDAAVDSADRIVEGIRALGRSAATAAACDVPAAPPSSVFTEVELSEQDVQTWDRLIAEANVCGRCGGRRGEMTCPACGGNEVRGPVCETCQGRRGEYSYPDEEGDPGNQLMNLPHWHDCPDCGGTGGANTTGEGDR